MKSKTQAPSKNRPKSGLNSRNQQTSQSDRVPKYEFDDSMMSPLKQDQLNQASYSSSQKKVTIRDLCPEDKAKIGELIKRLAEEKESKEQLVQELQDKLKKYRKTVHNIKKYNEKVVEESKATEQKFKASLEVIKQLQESDLSKNKENKAQNYQTSSSSPTKRVLIQQVAGDSENKLSSKPQLLLPDSQKAIVVHVNSFSEDFSQITKAAETANLGDKSQTEIMKLKAEIEEITNGLKELHFAKYQEPLEERQSQPLQQSPSFSAENKVNFAKEFMLFEQKIEKLSTFAKPSPNKQESNSRKVVVPKVQKKTFVENENSSDSEENEIEIAKKLLSLKKQKIQQAQDDRNANFRKFSRIKEVEEQQSEEEQVPKNQKTEEAKLLQKKFESQLYGDQQVEELEKLNKNLDHKLQSLMGTSQSYSLSFNLSHNQNDFTPQNQRSGVDQSQKFMRTKEVEVNKFIDSAVPSNKKGRLVDEGSSSLMSTPQPLNHFPEKQIEPEKQTGFSFKQQQYPIPKQDQFDEINDLIESLNSGNYSKKKTTLRGIDEEIMKSNSTLKGVKPKNQGFYGSNLLDVIDSIDRPERLAQSQFRVETNESFQRGKDVSISQSSQYHKLMDKYSRLAEYYNQGIDQSEQFSDFEIDVQR